METWPEKVKSTTQTKEFLYCAITTCKDAGGERLWLPGTGGGNPLGKHDGDKAGQEKSSYRRW